ncbi:hypothetical protein JAAARDRAFT_189527 [Jaapia argillacea MUCL 33604]|uniref:FIST domain-containing protein n=1 Tax=Jaapia argillacea MUCL 33604 TaxID=933084 RepID=A0A067Q7J9_9AGAM|nr:hypothetical protein JAAARDRAFT_189527 [Jaapia argillacea MUCL 33604]
MALHTSTILSRTPAALLSYLSTLPKSFSGHPILFALATSTTGTESDLSSLVSHLTSISSQSIGCLSAPAPHSPSHTWISCSIAVFDKRIVTPFRSTIPGRAAVQVGRWHAFRKKGDVVSPGQEAGLEENVNWDDVWNKNVEQKALPDELQSLKPGDVNSVIFLSDSAPEGISNSLSAFPHATKLGLLASSTPFITGRPVTLFHNKNIYSSGAVGLALHGGSAPAVDAHFHGLQPVSSTLTVTNSEGNLVHTLDNLNPSKLLLDAIKKSGIQQEMVKEDDFYLGALGDGKLSQVYRIMSGDPSRGTMSLQSGAAPPEGTPVQLFYKPNSLIPHAPPLKPCYGRSLSFVTSPLDLLSEEIPEVPGVGVDDLRVINGAFLAASENGWVLSRSRGERKVEEPWRCIVEGGVADLRWSE